MKVIEIFKNKYAENYGYIPTDAEIVSLYYKGELSLTDEEENAIIKYLLK